MGHMGPTGVRNRAGAEQMVQPSGSDMGGSGVFGELDEEVVDAQPVDAEAGHGPLVSVGTDDDSRAGVGGDGQGDRPNCLRLGCHPASLLGD